MNDSTSGWFWHVHHDRLMEWSDNIQERIDYIKTEKPANEIETRLRLLKPVRGPLPDRFDKAGAEYDKAGAECDKAWAEYDKARAEYGKARAEYDKARAEYDKAWAEYGKEIEALHHAECPDCPWDGETIFPVSGAR